MLVNVIQRIFGISFDFNTLKKVDNDEFAKFNLNYL